MAHGANVQPSEIGNLQVSPVVKTVYSVCLLAGAIGFAATIATDPTRAWHAYLVGVFYFVTLALGGLFFCAIHFATGAGWSVNVRRFAESFSTFLPIGLVASLILVVGGPLLYDWMVPAKVAADRIIAHKAPYLNTTFFIIRLVVFFGLWILFQRILVGGSIKQDATGDSSLTKKLVAPSVAFLMVFALSYSFYSVDLLMSLEAHWFSTIFGVYAFGGMFQATMAAMILLILYARHQNPKLSRVVTEDHLHDLGKYMFAFTVFWAYIAFSQYMLIWYANLPEETIFFKPRSYGGWLWVSLGLLMFRFIVPFIALLPRWAKRTPNHLAAVSVLILVMQFVDIYWLVYPNMLPDQSLRFGLQELAIFAGFLGLFLLSVTQFMSRHNMIPLRDPRSHESMAHHVVY